MASKRKLALTPHSRRVEGTVRLRRMEGLCRFSGQDQHDFACLLDIASHVQLLHPIEIVALPDTFVIVSTSSRQQRTVHILVHGKASNPQSIEAMVRENPDVSGHPFDVEIWTSERVRAHESLKLARFLHGAAHEGPVPSAVLGSLRKLVLKRARSIRELHEEMPGEPRLYAMVMAAVADGHFEIVGPFENKGEEIVIHRRSATRSAISTGAAPSTTSRPEFPSTFPEWAVKKAQRWARRCETFDRLDEAIKVLPNRSKIRKEFPKKPTLTSFYELGLRLDHEIEVGSIPYGDITAVLGSAQRMAALTAKRAWSTLSGDARRAREYWARWKVARDWVDLVDQRTMPEARGGCLTSDQLQLVRRVWRDAFATPEQLLPTDVARLCLVELKKHRDSDVDALPSISTIIRGCSDVSSAQSVVRARAGDDAAQKVRPVRLGPIFGHVGEMIDIDETELPVYFRDGNDVRKLRLAVAIDVATRKALAYWVGTAPFNQLAGRRLVAATLRPRQQSLAPSSGAVVSIAPLNAVPLNFRFDRGAPFRVLGEKLVKNDLAAAFTGTRRPKQHANNERSNRTWQDMARFRFPGVTAGARNAPGTNPKDGALSDFDCVVDLMTTMLSDYNAQSHGGLRDASPNDKFDELMVLRPLNAAGTDRLVSALLHDEFDLEMKRTGLTLNGVTYRVADGSVAVGETVAALRPIDDVGTLHLRSKRKGASAVAAAVDPFWTGVTIERLCDHQADQRKRRKAGDLKKGTQLATARETKSALIATSRPQTKQPGEMALKPESNRSSPREFLPRLPGYV